MTAEQAPTRLLLDLLVCVWVLFIAAQYLGGQLIDALAGAARVLG